MSYQRIICLVPSLTELLVDLGLKNRIIGRTRFCIHPEEVVSDIEIVGGTKNPNIEKIQLLKPDLIIANREENRKEDIEELQSICEVIVTEIDTIENALLWIYKLGEKLDIKNTADELITHIHILIDKIPESEPLRTAYFIWKDPWMTIGKDTYIHDVMKRYRLINVFGQFERYPTTSLEELSGFDPELILLSSEPFPFKSNHIEEIREFCPNSTIELVNGEWFSWYGSRMIKAFNELNLWRPK